MVFCNSFLSFPFGFRLLQYSALSPVQSFLSCFIQMSSLKMRIFQPTRNPRTCVPEVRLTETVLLSPRPCFSNSNSYQTAILSFPIASRKNSRCAICLKSPSWRIVPAVSVRPMKKFWMISVAWHFSNPGSRLRGIWINMTHNLWVMIYDDVSHFDLCRTQNDQIPRHKIQILVWDSSPWNLFRLDIFRDSTNYWKKIYLIQHAKVLQDHRQ